MAANRTIDINYSHFFAQLWLLYLCFFARLHGYRIKVRYIQFPMQIAQAYARLFIPTQHLLVVFYLYLCDAKHF